MQPEFTFQPSILLTGATGLLGRACLPHLIARHGAERIVALVRRGRDTSELEALGLRSVEVDLCASNLRIAVPVFRLLSESIHSIIHAAADIRFGISLAESRCVNVLGTENLLRFAAQCSRLHRFAYISTVYVSNPDASPIRISKRSSKQNNSSLRQWPLFQPQFIDSAPWFTTARLNG
jgi:thioester reductase-like protein